MSELRDQIQHCWSKTFIALSTLKSQIDCGIFPQSDWQHEIRMSLRIMAEIIVFESSSHDLPKDAAQFFIANEIGSTCLDMIYAIDETNTLSDFAVHFWATVCRSSNCWAFVQYHDSVLQRLFNILHEKSSVQAEILAALAILSNYIAEGFTHRAGMHDNEDLSACLPLSFPYMNLAVQKLLETDTLIFGPAASYKIPSFDDIRRLALSVFSCHLSHSDAENIALSATLHVIAVFSSGTAAEFSKAMLFLEAACNLPGGICLPQTFDQHFCCRILQNAYNGCVDSPHISTSIMHAIGMAISFLENVELRLCLAKVSLDHVSATAIQMEPFDSEHISSYAEIVHTCLTDYRMLPLFNQGLNLSWTESVDVHRQRVNSVFDIISSVVISSHDVIDQAKLSMFYKHHFDTLLKQSKICHTSLTAAKFPITDDVIVSDEKVLSLFQRQIQSLSNSFWLPEFKVSQAIRCVRFLYTALLRLDSVTFYAQVDSMSPGTLANTLKTLSVMSSKCQGIYDYMEATALLTSNLYMSKTSAASDNSDGFKTAVLCHALLLTSVAIQLRACRPTTCIVYE